MRIVFKCTKIGLQILGIWYCLVTQLLTCDSTDISSHYGCTDFTLTRTGGWEKWKNKDQWLYVHCHLFWTVGHCVQLDNTELFSKWQHLYTFFFFFAHLETNLKKFAILFGVSKYRVLSFSRSFSMAETKLYGLII